MTINKKRNRAPKSEKAHLCRVVSLILRGAETKKIEPENVWEVTTGEGCLHIQAQKIDELISQGVLAQTSNGLHCRTEARSWLKRMRLQSTQQAQTPQKSQPTFNSSESPLARLAGQTEQGQPFLQPQQIAAGERFRQLFERAQMRQRITMSYDPNRSVDKSAPVSGNPLGDMGQDARNQIAELLRRLPEDAASAVLNVCGFEKGLQQLEAEKHWPRRCGKMVLRIGLDMLAQEMGFTRTDRHVKNGGTHAWRDEQAIPNVLG